MLNVCHNCGEFQPAKGIDPSGPYAVCPLCGYNHPFLHLPLLVVAGASGTGKSTVLHILTNKTPKAILLESDILWQPEYNKPEDNYKDYFELWLRMGKNISQSGRPVVLFGAGFIPENLENCIERRYFSSINYLALVCDDDLLQERLQNRPAWRDSSRPEYIEEHIQFNQWFKTKAQNLPYPIILLDTSSLTVEQAAHKVDKWISKTITSARWKNKTA